VVVVGRLVEGGGAVVVGVVLTVVVGMVLAVVEGGVSVEELMAAAARLGLKAAARRRKR
jgi:hypothetical protein